MVVEDTIRQQRVSKARQVAANARAAADAAVAAAEAAESNWFDLSLSEVGGGRLPQEPSPIELEDSGLSLQPVERQPDNLVQFQGTSSGAPDDWIETYLSGRKRPTTFSQKGQPSSLRTELESYSGKAVEWFCWIDLFHALVHQTTKLPGEKQAILKRSLKGECVDLVYGLGGGEEAYKEALRRLRLDYGRRDVMRAAHLHALERMELTKGDPIGFKRFADRERTNLFDLTRIGEAGHGTIIERIVWRH